MDGRRFCFDCLKSTPGEHKHLLLRRCYNNRYQQLLKGYQPAAVRLKMPTRRRECPRCGEVFQHAMGMKGHDRCYCQPCAREYRAAYHRGIDLAGIERECRWCFSSFTTQNLTTFTCSEPCAKAQRLHWRTHRAPDRCHLRLCLDCGGIVPGFSPSTNRCNPCQFNVEKARRNFAEARRAQAYREGDKGIWWQSLGDRDGWACHLCGRPVTKRPGTSERRRAAVVDHLVPIAEGGTHTWDNVAIAHWDCNQKRGATGAAQLRLVG
jgi:5-methylcytosine-specific restriction endonuclease McrA